MGGWFFFSHFFKKLPFFSQKKCPLFLTIDIDADISSEYTSQKKYLDKYYFEWLEEYVADFYDLPKNIAKG